MFKRASLGVLAGFLFMVTEGLGSLLLIKSLFAGGRDAAASHFTLVTYLWLALNVVGNGIGFVAAREAAKGRMSSGLLQLVAQARRLLLGFMLPAVVIAGLSSWLLAANGRLGTADALGLTCLVAGHALRWLVLGDVFVWVGARWLGADKWYQWLASGLFYAAALGAVHAIEPSLLLVGASYLGATAVTAALGHAWCRRRARDVQDHLSREHVASLARPAFAMMGFSAAGFVAGNADALVARVVLDDNTFVQYALAAKVGQVIAIAAGLIPAMFGPRITRAHHEGEAVVASRMRHLSAALAFGAAAVGALLVLLAREVVVRWFAPGGGEVLSMVLWVCVGGAVLQALNLALANALNSVGAPGVTTVTLVSAVAGVVAASIGAWMANAVGIAVGTVVASVVMLLGMARLNRNTFGRGARACL